VLIVSVPLALGCATAGTMHSARFIELPKFDRLFRAGTVLIVSVPLALGCATAGTMHSADLPASHRRREAQDGAAWHFYYSERLFSDDRSQVILQPISVKLPHRLIATYQGTLSH
jgi:hypothetical protein